MKYNVIARFRDKHTDELHVVGSTVDIDDLDRAQDLIRRKLVASTPCAPEVQKEKALSKMNRAELDAVVAAEGIDVGDASTNDTIREAIEKARSAKSPAAETSGDPDEGQSEDSGTACTGGDPDEGQSEDSEAPDNPEE